MPIPRHIRAARNPGAKLSYWQDVVKPGLLGMMILASIALCGMAAKAQEADTAPALRPVSLMTLEAQGGALERQFFGKVAARQTVDLAFQVGGQIQRLDAPKGVYVEEGQLLAELDLEPFRRAVTRAELSLEQAERTVARLDTLADQNVGSRVQAEDAETQAALAEVQLREARDALRDATLRAPFDGLVANRLVANFNTVSPGQPILRLHDMSEVWIEIDIPERLFDLIEDPRAVGFTATLSDRNADIPVELREFTAETNGVGQTYTVSVALPDRADLNPIPGQSASVVVRVDQTLRPGFVVPASAVMFDADARPYVMVFSPTGADEGQVARVPVTLSSVDGTTLQIDGDLQAGQEIVLSGGHLLQDGQSVRRFLGFNEIN
ncbi:RND family efflux transporter MFP subunit [Rubricella aquisinus]|uniref:RND family efflux transporter MFP subunit n=1 Tax=Rubricella aquisinus TaxID=2028108 RepID=A0A840X2E9_9RHOB|nr:efflux RND transporter periplasmic adaptor subunit [Rubricella aquisinus]MBB5516045.1 RND family efflux transporter MFP subunit [Rubricella aquisinus]